MVYFESSSSHAASASPRTCSKLLPRSSSMFLRAAAVLVAEIAVRTVTASPAPVAKRTTIFSSLPHASSVLRKRLVL